MAKIERPTASGPLISDLQRHLVLLADDLTGALDAGAAFLCKMEAIECRLHDAITDQEIVSAGDTDHAQQRTAPSLLLRSSSSRGLPPTEARRRVADVLREIRVRGQHLCYKKIDSTMRGSVGAELEECLQQGVCEAILLAPANPAAGRTVSRGILYVDGLPVHRSAFANDPTWPVREGSVEALLRMTCETDIISVPLAYLRAGPQACADFIEAAHARGTRIFVLDAESDVDLDVAVKARGYLGERYLLAGSGGLAKAWAASLPHLDAGGRACDTVAAPAQDAAALFICGSAHMCNRKQARQLAQVAGLPIMTVDPRREMTEPHYVDEMIGHLERAFNRDGGASLFLPTRRDRMDADAFSAAAGLDILAEIARRLSVSPGFGYLFLTGGDTALAVCHALRLQRLHLLTEIEPGVAGVRMQGASVPLTGVIKPGGFGSAATMVRSLSWLHAQHPSGHRGPKEGRI